MLLQYSGGLKLLKLSWYEIWNRFFETLAASQNFNGFLKCASSNLLQYLLHIHTAHI